MNKHILFSGILTAATVLGAQSATPTFVELSNLKDIISNGYCHGNAILVDVNNDGNFEIVGKGRDLNNSWQTDIFCVSGDGYSFTKNNMLSDPDGCSWERVVVPIDYNCDGNVDLILASSWNAKLLINNGDGTFDVNKGLVDGFALDGEISIDGDDSEKWYSGLMAVADFNGDGYPDILTFCGDPRNDQGTLTIFINEKGSGKFTKNETTGLKAHRGGTLAVGDFNRDGLMDIAVSGWNDDFGNDCIKVYKNNGDLTFTEVASDSFAKSKAGVEKGAIKFLDINNDGYLDLLVTGESCVNDWAKSAFLFKNVNGTDFVKMEAGLQGICKSGIDWCDLNGDGFVDFVYSGESDKAITIISYNNGDGTFTLDSTSIGGHRGGSTVELGDFNNNLVPDMLVMGYNDNGPHFQIYNSMQSRGVNTVPSAPVALSAKSEGDATVFTWEAGSDKETPAEALRYNFYAKLTDGQIITLVPVDAVSGKLKQANVDASLTGTSYCLNVPLDKISEWCVQSIDGGKATSQFAMASTAGVEDMEQANASFVIDGSILTVSADMEVEIFSVSGVSVMKSGLKSGESVSLDMKSGIYVVKTSSYVTKIVVK